MGCSNLCRTNFPCSTCSARGVDGGAAIVFADGACCGTASLGIAKTEAHKPARTNRRMLRSKRKFISPPVDRRSFSNQSPHTNRNSRFVPLACAEYASPALDTTNWPQEEAPGRSRRSWPIGQSAQEASRNRPQTGLWEIDRALRLVRTCLHNSRFWTDDGQL